MNVNLTPDQNLVDDARTFCSSLLGVTGVREKYDVHYEKVAFRYLKEIIVLFGYVSMQNGARCMGGAAWWSVWKSGFHQLLVTFTPPLTCAFLGDNSPFPTHSTHQEPRHTEGAMEDVRIRQRRSHLTSELRWVQCAAQACQSALVQGCLVHLFAPVRWALFVPFVQTPGLAGGVLICWGLVCYRKMRIHLGNWVIQKTDSLLLGCRQLPCTESSI